MGRLLFLQHSPLTMWRVYTPRFRWWLVVVANNFQSVCKPLFITSGNASFNKKNLQIFLQIFLKSFLMDDLSTLHYIHYWCWWPGVVTSQGIISHGIDIVVPEYSNPSNSRVNALSPEDAYMRQWTGSRLVLIMAIRQIGGKPVYEWMLTYCLLNPW